MDYRSKYLTFMGHATFGHLVNFTPKTLFRNFFNKWPRKPKVGETTFIIIINIFENI